MYDFEILVKVHQLYIWTMPL